MKNSISNMDNNTYEVIGEIEEILPMATGLSKAGFWSSRSFVIRTNGKYRNRLFFICWQEISHKLDPLKPGDLVVVNFYINSKKNKERWYPDLLVTDITLRP